MMFLVSDLTLGASVAEIEHRAMRIRHDMRACLSVFETERDQ